VIPVFSSGQNAKHFPYEIHSNDLGVSSGQTAYYSVATLIGSVLIGSERVRPQKVGFQIRTVSVYKLLFYTLLLSYNRQEVTVGSEYLKLERNTLS
jgi:hypothetical protein